MNADENPLPPLPEPELPGLDYDDVSQWALIPEPPVSAEARVQLLQIELQQLSRKYTLQHDLDTKALTDMALLVTDRTVMLRRAEGRLLQVVRALRALMKATNPADHGQTKAQFAGALQKAYSDAGELLLLFAMVE